MIRAFCVISLSQEFVVRFTDGIIIVNVHINCNNSCGVVSTMTRSTTSALATLRHFHFHIMMILCNNMVIHHLKLTPCVYFVTSVDHMTVFLHYF